LVFLVGFLVGLIESNKKYLTCNLHNKKLKDNTKINKPAGAGAPLTNDQASFSFGEGLGMRASPLPFQQASPAPLQRRGGPLFDFHV